MLFGMADCKSDNIKFVANSVIAMLLYRVL